VNNGQGKVVQFDIANGALTNPNGSGNPPSYAAGSGANEIAVDPGSWFAYLTTSNGIVGYPTFSVNLPLSLAISTDRCDI
jgi:hypothetical protein